MSCSRMWQTNASPKEATFIEIGNKFTHFLVENNPVLIIKLIIGVNVLINMLTMVVDNLSIPQLCFVWKIVYISMMLDSLLRCYKFNMYCSLCLLYNVMCNMSWLFSTYV